MIEQEQNKFKEEIIKFVIQVPGLIGLVDGNGKSIDLLSKEDMIKGIDISMVSKSYDVKIFVIISEDVRAEVVSREISSSINSYFKNISKKKVNINIFIRGVK